MRSAILLAFPIGVVLLAGSVLLAVPPLPRLRTRESVTEQKRAEEERDRMEVELRLSHKLEAVGQLAAGLAHEVNTPIQFVSDSIRFLREGFDDLVVFAGVVADLLASDVTLSPEVRARLEQALETADVAYLRERIPAAFERSLDGVGRVATLVRAMKEFSRPSAAEGVPSDINALLENTLVIARNELEYVADVETDLGPIPHVPCNPDELNQVFLNLVVNSAHAIADVVSGEERGTLTVRSYQEGDCVVVELADTGGGIPDEIRSRVFDPFFTTKDVGRGSGHGLAIARAIVVDRHGGTIALESEVGQGTTFFVRLPLGERSLRQEALAA